VNARVVWVCGRVSVLCAYVCACVRVCVCTCVRVVLCAGVRVYACVLYLYNVFVCIYILHSLTHTHTHTHTGYRRDRGTDQEGFRLL
jgi:hypothetical protein